MKNKRMKYLIAIIMTILLIAIGIGGKIYMDKKSFNDEMLKVVKSDEAKGVYEKVLKNIDSEAFTKKGVIHSYEVDYENIRHNPMGGIMVIIYINSDSDLYVRQTLNKDNSTGKLTGGGGGYSSELDDLLNKRGITND